ncbi:hypothetical protein OQY15_22215 [Pedobacter sp. MC2016-15]|uniref:hypothetical protein n=1 Tax=Pedobacter sp. MC2016-15 TaxID=2994473 RepID=UPI002245EBD0|nr:hypothetical protein [Pedobacter sp. MC2016-15]MCX2481831.1 hypothetical protein [Pedobacter sp. MC2016-15]
MKNRGLNKDNLWQMPESELAALVLSELRGRTLFPEKLAAAKEDLKIINQKLAEKAANKS